MITSKNIAALSSNWPSLKVSGHEVIWLASGLLLPLRDRQGMARDRGDLNFSKDFACLPSFHFLSFCPCTKLMNSEGSPPALISLWPSGNPLKEYHCHFAWRAATDVTIQLESAKTHRVSNLFLRDIPGRTESTERWRRNGHRMGSSLERFVVVSGELVPTCLLEALGVAAWVFGCHRSWQWVQTSLCCAIKDMSLTGRNPHDFIAEEITTASIRCPAEFRNWHETPMPSNVAPSTGTLRNTLISGQWERWRRKKTGEQPKRVQKFAWIPQLKLFDTDRFWAVFPQSLVLVYEKLRVFPISICTVAIAQEESCPEASRKPSYPDTLREGQWKLVINQSTVPRKSSKTMSSFVKVFRFSQRPQMFWQLSISVNAQISLDIMDRVMFVPSAGQFTIIYIFWCLLARCPGCFQSIGRKTNTCQGWLGTCHYLLFPHLIELAEKTQIPVIFSAEEIA